MLKKKTLTFVLLALSFFLLASMAFDSSDKTKQAAGLPADLEKNMQSFAGKLKEKGGGEEVLKKN